MFNREQGTLNLFQKGVKAFFSGFLIICVLFSYGGGSSFVQGIAWVSMLPAQIAHSESFKDGLEKTFNGENPCSVCELASVLRDSEYKSQSLDLSSKSHTQNETLKSPDITEKTHVKFSQIQCLPPSTALLLVPSEYKYFLYMTTLDVDIPPPDLT